MVASISGSEPSNPRRPRQMNHLSKHLRRRQNDEHASMTFRPEHSCSRSDRFRFRMISLALLVLLGSPPLPASGPDASGPVAPPYCGTYPGRVLDELILHRQYVLQRQRAGFVPQAGTATSNVDVGHIAVVPDDGTLVSSANFFDLDGMQLQLEASGTGYTVSASSGALDNEAISGGNPASLGDDDTREVAIGFSFLFFGQSYTKIFINSDGNLTFLAGDSASSERSLSRMLSGAPRISPYFADLNPADDGQLSYFASPDRFVVSWIDVPDFSFSGFGPLENFQVTLFPDGRIRFVYAGINGTESVAGISAGNLFTPPLATDLSTMTGSIVHQGAIAEVFTPTTSLDITAVAKRFYATHDDAYEFLVVFTNFNFNGAFAFELNVSNDVTGLGAILNPPLFDFSDQFGSSRLESILNMGNLGKYPEDPLQVFLRGVDSTVSIMGQEAGHRFLSYVTFDDPSGSSNSTQLLGRDLQHWSFLFNSDASVMEGNRILDNGDGTFTTIGAVERYNEFDQYLMGLRSPADVAPSFFVSSPVPFTSASRTPALNVSFSGTRNNVSVDQVIAASGARWPNEVTAPKRFQFAFLLVTPHGTTAPADQVTHLDRIRQEWEGFFSQATSFRGTADTELIQSLRTSPQSLGLLSGESAQGTVKLQAARSTPLSISLSSSSSASVSVPSEVLIPAGALSGTFAISAAQPGRASIDASAPGYKTATTVVEVISADLLTADLSLTITDGNGQSGNTGTILTDPLRVMLQDQNRIPYAGVTIEFTVVEGAATILSPTVSTDNEGRAATKMQLGVAGGPVEVEARVVGTSLSARFLLDALGIPSIPQGGIVNGASFAPGSVSLSPGSIISIFGVSLASSTVSASSVPLPNTLANTRVEIDGQTAPLFFVSPGQVNAQVPAEISPSSVSLQVRNGTQVTPAVEITLGPAGPGIFSLDSSGSGPGAITHADSQVAVSATFPARPGEFLQIFANGLGPVTPPVATGFPASAEVLSTTDSGVEATIGGVPAEVSFSGLAPGFVGLYQMNVRVPEIADGVAEVIVTVNGSASNPVTIQISNSAP